MSFRGVVHAEIWPLEVGGGTGGTQYLRTFAALMRNASEEEIGAV